jgi:hypothetical protein
MNGTLSYQPVDKTTAIKELESFIVDWKYGRKSVPTKLHPEHIEEFINDRVKRSLHPASFNRSRRVVDFYDLTKALSHFEKILDRKEKDEREFNQSIECVMTLAQVGGTEEQKKARDYYDYLLRNPLAKNSFEELTDAVDAFGPELDTQTLSSTMTAEFQNLQGKVKTDKEADDAAQNIDGLIHNELPRAIADRDLRSRVLALPNTEDRIDQLCRVYLGWTESDTEELTWWAARQLRRQSREGRTDVILKSLKNITKEIQLTDFEEKEKFSYRLRSARAVRFFGGTLSTKERYILAQPDEGQIDVLNRE